MLLGDYLYAHGLVRIAEAGGVEAVAAMAELISRCASLRAAGESGDGEAWVDAARALGGEPSGDEIAAALAPATRLGCRRDCRPRGYDPAVIFDAASDGLHIISAMLIVGLVFLGVDRPRRAREGGLAPAQGAPSQLLLDRQVAPPADLRDVDRAPRARGRARPRRRRGRPAPRGDRDRRPHRQGGRPGAPVRAPEGKRAPAARSTSSAPSGACASPSASSDSTTSGRSSPTCSRCSRPPGLVDKLRGLKQLKSIADSLPNTVRKGACQEVVLQGDDVDLGPLPVQTCWPLDAAPFITLPAVITRDPRTGQRNVGMYRMQVLGPRSTAMHWQLHKDGRADFTSSRRADGGRGRARPRPGHRLQRERAAPEAHRRADVRRASFAARRSTSSRA